MTEKPACGNCRFWKLNHGFGYGQGLCLRRAPVALIPACHDDIEAQWPPVGATQWCGEHEPKPGRYDERDD